jgi:hypothetical protein
MREVRPGRRSSSATLLALCLALGVGSAACRIDENDVRRWETTLHGPEKIQAVLFHEKYETPLRVEAALSLIRMKPRGGRHVGIPILVDTLAEVAPESRGEIVARLVPAIITQLKEPPPASQAGQAPPPDESFPYKDAAYAMLTHDKTVIVSDEALKESLEQTLIDWAMADFENRLVNRTQSYGMEQLLQYLGANAVVGIPKLMTEDTRQLDKMARLVADLGSDETKTEGSAQLTKVAEHVTSDAWTKKKTPELQAANAASKLEPTEKQFQAQLEKFQDEELFRVFASMKVVGGRPSVNFLLDFAKNDKQGEKRRQAALAALEGRLDRDNPDDLKRILDIVTAGGAPDAVLDQAFRRIGELPREKVVDKLYKMFETDKWKVRRAAAATVLQMSKASHTEEFLEKLPGGDGKGYAMPEAITYGAMLGDLKEGEPFKVLDKYLSRGTGAQRATALAAYFEHGKLDDIGKLEAFKGDGQPVPVCEEDNQCKWACYVPKEGAKDPKTDRELKDVKTVGEFVSLCIVPGIRENAERKKAEEDAAKKRGPGKGDDAKDEKKDGEKKDDEKKEQ